MGKSTGLGNRFAVGGYDLGGDIQTLSQIGGGVAAPLDATDIEKSAMARMGSVLAADGVASGIYDGAMTAAVYFNPSTDRAHQVFSALPSTSALFSFHSSALLGAAVANLVGKQIDYAGGRQQDGSFLYSVSAQESDGLPLEWGVATSTFGQSLSGAGNLTGVDLGSGSPGAYGAVIFLHAFSFTGTSVTLKAQHSNDNGGGDAYADIAGATFSAVSAGHGWQRVETGAIAIKQWVRLVASGTFSAATIASSIHRRNALKSY